MKIKNHQFPFKFLRLTRKVCIFLFFIFHLGSLLAQNVGINVPNPAWPLDISAGQGVIRLQSTTAYYGSVLELKNNYASAEYLGAINFNDPFGFYPGQIGYLANHNLTFRTSSFERMRITPEGRLGIGTTTPANTLEVSDPLSTLRLRANNNGNGARIILDNDSNVGGNPGAIFFENESGDWQEYITCISDGTLAFYTNGNSRLRINSDGETGIGLVPSTNTLEVSGNASKSIAGDWIANSDVRLKKNVQLLESAEMLDKLLQLQGITYEWNDDSTGYARPEGIHYGFTAQNIQQVFPTLVEEDNLGYLQTAYGTYDPMMVEAIRALNEKIQFLLAEVERLNQQLLNSNSNHNEAAKD